MSRLSTGFIDSCARNLGGEQLKIHFPWDGSQYDQFLSKKPSSVIRAPEWVDLPADCKAADVGAVMGGIGKQQIELGFAVLEGYHHG